MLSEKLEKFKSEICEKGIENVFKKMIKKNCSKHPKFGKVLAKSVKKG